MLLFMFKENEGREENLGLLYHFIVFSDVLIFFLERKKDRQP